MRQTKRGSAERRHEAITRGHQGEVAQRQPAQGERVGGMIYRAGRLSHLAPLLKQRAWGGAEALEWATSHGT